jgi:hypothetical protein
VDEELSKFRDASVDEESSTLGDGRALAQLPTPRDARVLEIRSKTRNTTMDEGPFGLPERDEARVADH